GLTAVIHPGTTTFSQGDLTGTWRVKSLRGEVFPGTTTEGAFGSLAVQSNGVFAMGQSLTLFPSFVSQPILGGSLHMDSSDGTISGVVITGNPAAPDFRDVTAFMSPDKSFVAGITRLGPPASLNESGMFFLQRAPTVSYTTADLAGTWQFVGMEARRTDSGHGNWYRGTLALNGNGSVVSGSLFDAFENNVTVLFGDLGISPQGFISGSVALSIGNDVFIEATMFGNKRQIIGLYDSAGEFPAAEGLFTLIKPGMAPPPPASTVQFHNATAKVTEGGTAVIQVDRTGSKATTVTVDYTATAGTAAPGDFTAVSGTLTIAANLSTASFNVPTFGNSTVDGDRTVILSLSNPTNGATLGTIPTATLTIVNDDALVQFAQPAFTTKEGMAGVITVNRSGALAFPATVGYNVSALDARAGIDFTAVSGTLTFLANQTSKTFSVPTFNLPTVDGNRSALLTLFTPPTNSSAVTVLGPQATALLTILDDDKAGIIKLSSATYRGDEGKSVAITIVRQPVGNAPLASNVSVSYATSSNGSAVAGLDYTATSGTVTFTSPTDVSRTINVPLLLDGIVEGPETFLFSLGSPTMSATLGSPSTATVTINDVDKGGLVSLSASTYSVSEGAGNISITVKRSGGNAANVSVLFTTSNGTATAGDDYGNVSTTVVFGLNETTRSVVIPIFQDTLAEGAETFNVTLSNVQGGATLGNPSSATVTIVDDESAIQFASSLFSAKEGTSGKIDVIRSGALVTTSVVSYNISSLTAVPGVDFKGPLAGTLTFAPNVTKQSFMIPTVNNTKVDGNRSVLLTLGSPTGGAQLGTNATATFTIVDDDQPGVFRLGNATYTVKEGDAVMVDIMRLPAPGNGGPLGGNISISYLTSPGNASAGSDYTPVSGTVVFGPNDTKKTVVVPTLQDMLVEPTENFFFTIGAPTGGATLGSPSTATILIQDDDQAGVVFLSQTAYKVSEAGGNISITVMRSGGGANASVDFATVPGTATDGFFGGDRPSRSTPAFPEGADYGAVSTTLFFGVNEMKKTVVIPILQDNLGEGDEVFTVVLSNPQGGLKLGTPSSAPVTIVDDEVVIQFNGKFKNNQPVVVRTGPLTANVSVDYFAASGTAILGDDFILPPGTLVFPPGVSERTIPIKTINDNIAEGPETFTITLTNPSPPAQLGPFVTQLFTLDDNDFGGTVGFGNTSVTAAPGQTKSLNIVRSKDGAGTVMTVGWSAIGGTAVPGVDFSPASGEVTFHESQFSLPFAVTIGSGPAVAGKTIVFGLTIPGAGAAKLAASNVSTLTILGTPVPGYSFTVLYSGAETVGLPSINDDGGFAFSVNEETPTVFSGNLAAPADLRTVTELPDSGVQSLRGIRFPVDSSERVAFQANLTAGYGVVLDSNSSAPTVFFATGDGIDSVGEPSMSFNGTLAFKTIEQCDGTCEAVHFSPDAQTDNYAIISGDTTSIGFVNTIGDFPAVNDGGLVAFTATMYTGEKGVFTSNGSAIVTLASAPGPLDFADFGPSVSINNNGHVAFIGILADGNASVNYAYGDAVSVSTLGVASTSPGGFTSFGTGSDASPAISNSGRVAFVGFYAGGHGIFVGGDLVGDRVVATGDVIDGHTVASLQLGGINADGDISFMATFTDGRVAAVVASPPPPVECGVSCGRPPLGP
ncbi:MAG TPA: Calx-beta domain-containing protein, partial [Methylomirabilota bacterium]